ncbi:protein-disulfide reductase DsbD domain-containing protein [Labrenzia sp. CE80]|uniref:protein-disulfide reductase DsbD domain-containing protein n=1 Tax=Labrenzia sp. CE80 TaxID=1788986 RepID=UPI00129BEDED|nr:protein-disulfide reductase DsbD domain-containing protein [Labrenzia sp. CE80]
MVKRLFIILASFTYLSVLVSSAASAAVTEWASVHGGAVRLIASGPLQDGTYKAGIEFSMEPGWHTYWRFPGEAGIPPMINFEASKNLQKSEVLFPAPSRYDDGFSNSIVYHDAVVLPVIVTPEDAGAPIDLSLSMFFGICKDICVPGDANLSLSLSPDGKTDALATKLIDRDLELVPAAMSNAAPKVLGVDAETTDNGHQFLITAEVSDTAEIDLFAEGPEGSYIALPALLQRDGAQAIWSLSSRGLVQSEKGSSLTFVLVDGNTAVETKIEVPPELLPKTD